MKEKSIFSEVKLKSGLVIKNRFVKSAMNEAMGKRNLQPKEEIANLYRLWAEGGAGMIITGNVMVDKNYLAEPGNVVFDENSDFELLNRWAIEGQKNGAKIIVQINHPGKQAPKTVSKQPVAPSSIAISGNIGNMFNKPRELTNSEIHELVKSFARTAKVAKDSGFNGVQIHSAHGYLINQFLSPLDNVRTDEYGGNLENRMRFLKEIYLAIREEVGYNFTVGLKINSSDFKEGGFSEEDSILVVNEMEKLGIDFIEVSGGSYESPKMNEDTNKNKNSIFFADYCKKLKEIIDTPIIVTGGIRSVSSMEEIIDFKIADFIGIARPLAIDVNIPNKIESGEYETLETKRVYTNVKFIDKKLGSLLGLIYYQMMMQKYAYGKIPKVNKTAWPALFHAIYHQGTTALFPQRAK